MKLTNEKLIDMYRTMVIIRKFENSLAEAVAAGVLPGFVHLGVGQEAVMVGIATGLEEGDWVASSHREHGLLLARGAELGRARAEIFGKATGYCKGKGGSMHLAVIDKHCTGCNGILGASQVIINGIAFALKYEKTTNVAAVVFGDGSSERGEFHEALNLAALWKLPTLFCCVNNQYGISVSTKFSCAVEDIAARGIAYGIPGLVVDGNDVMAVVEAVVEASKRGRAGEGPTLLELKTSRHRGHFEGDSQIYRTKEEMEEVYRNDPIKRFEKSLLDRKILTPEMVAEIEASTDADLQAAIQFTDESPYPAFEEAMTDLFYEEVAA
jgi:acetoin:2,6-dichlorophenolindophenol oxidoreductase subunit alpha